VTIFERFEQEGKERGFCEHFVRPLLAQMGFVQVAYVHGTQEFGKDLVFTEVDRFGHHRHMAVQAKHVEKLNDGQLVTKLADQVKQAFLIPYKLVTTIPEERRVSAVYLFNSGAITHNAQQIIRHYVDEHLRPNVFFYDGDQLETLATTLIQRRDESILERLIVMRRQLLRNIVNWQDLMGKMNVDQDVTLHVRGTMFQSLDDWLIRPVMAEVIDYDQVTLLWELGNLIETMVQQFMFRPPDPTTRLDDFTRIHRACDKAFRLAQEIVPMIDKAVAILPRVTLDS
jgi:hypothetical protein